MDQRRAIQLSHNEISGEDDPATLKLLYNSIQDVGMRLYSALDDKKLELLDDVKPGSLAEANLQFQTVKMVFLPHELEAIEEAWKSVEELLGGVQVTWLADMESYDATLDAIEAASRAHGIKNTATALMVVLEVFTRHLADLKEGFLDSMGEPKDIQGIVPISVVLENPNIPPKAASLLDKAINHMASTGRIDPAKRADSLELLAKLYLESVGK